MKLTFFRYVPAPLLALAIWILSSLSTLPLPDTGLSFQDKLLHAGAYGILALVVSLWVSPGYIRRCQWHAWMIIVLISAAYGALDEVHQSFIPGRDTSFYDWLADLAGALIGASFAIFILNRHAKRDKVVHVLNNSERRHPVP